ncbi:hypothetical protein ACWEQ0_24950 [Nocardia thailandica]
MVRTAVIAIDRLRIRRTRAEVEVAAREIAAAHGYVVVGVLCGPELLLPDILDFVLDNDADVLIVPTLEHVDGNTAFVREICDLQAMMPPAHYTRLHRATA